MSEHPLPAKRHIARKRFGQNFLQDTMVIQQLIHCIQPHVDQQIIEIGPGYGAITIPLLEACKTLTVVELDRDLIPHLIKQCAASGELRVVQADALNVDYCDLRACHQQTVRIVGNLPYNISTPVLFHLMTQLCCIQDMHFMLQKEVVDRMVAAPGSKRYGRLSVMLQYYCDIQSLFLIPPSAFQPAPKVDSALVRLRPHASPPVAITNPTLFARLVSQAFSQRRKTLRNSIKQLLSSEQISRCDIDPGIRAENLSLQEFACLANLFADQAEA